MKEIKINATRASVTRRVGDDRWIRIVEDGVVVGVRDGWVQIWDPITIEGRLINTRPELAEWFPLEAKCLRVVFYD